MKVVPSSSSSCEGIANAFSVDQHVPVKTADSPKAQTLKNFLAVILRTTADSPKAPKIKYGSAVILRTTAVLVVSVFALSKIGLFDSHFWLALFLAWKAVDLSSQSLSAILTYIMPVALSTHLVLSGVFPSVYQCLFMHPSTLLLVGIPMSVCLHRYFAHQSFATTRAMQFVLAVVSTFAYQGPALWWAAKHRRHHIYCDQTEDPHSVKQAGFFYAWVLWTVNPENLNNQDRKFNVPAHLNLPELELLEMFHLAPVTLLLSIVDHFYGRGGAVYSVFLPMLSCRLVTLLFNVQFHAGDNPRKRCKSINHAEPLAIIVGEGEHDVHHKVPNQSKRGTYDLPYWLSIFWMEKVGLIWDCH